MNQDTPMSWPEQPHDESMMHPAGDDEFSNFLEFGINFPDLEGHGSGQRQRPLPNSGNSIPTTVGEQDMGRMDTDPTSQAPQYNPLVPDMAMDLGHHGQNPQPYGVNLETGFYPRDQQQHHQPHQHQQHRQHQQPPNHQNYTQGMIPPTPNSVELHGGAAQYPQRVEESHDMYDRYTRVNEEQAFYTPLISPAMTPLDTQFRMPEYTIPGEYFTPLTSPALEARNSNSNGYPFQTSQGPDMGFIQSPVDVNGVPVQSAPSSPGLSKKQQQQQQQQQQRRRPSATTRMTGRAGKQSPLVRPQTRRKQALSTQLHSDEVLNALEQQNGSRPTSGGSGLRYGSNESSQDSVSPEPLSEPLMPPPALPQSRKSPAMGPQTSEPKTSEAATPATLMRIQKRPHMHDATGHFSGQASLVPSESRDEVMEDVQLPEAATDTRPKMSRIDTTVHTKDQNRAAPSEKTPSIEPKSATERPPSSSVAPSPHPGAMPSPSGPTAKRPDMKAAITRKRQSVSSQISPALRPRISPSIQPLVRGDAGISSETSALYLASKSNYQHILDGTLLPGVSYPETLAENLSSKRTNHKLAEQGRRNRINTALKEIESLLPPGFAQERSRERKEAQGDGQGTPSLKPVEKERANHAISKASTVEMAIDYIKLLKKELEETKQKLKEAESKLEGKEVQDARDQAAPATGTEAEGKDDKTSNGNAQPVAEESKSA